MSVVDYNKIIRITKEAATFFTVPGVIRGREALLLSREELKTVFDLTEKEAENYGDPIGLGYKPSHPVVGVEGKNMPVSEIRARLAEIYRTPPEKKVEVNDRRGLLQNLLRFARCRSDE